MKKILPLACAVVFSAGCGFNLKNDLIPAPRKGYIRGRDADTPPFVVGKIDTKRNFPDKARACGVTEYAVTVICFINEDGGIDECEIERGDDSAYGFDETALSVLKMVEFRPGLRDNRPVKTATRVIIRFDSGG